MTDNAPPSASRAPGSRLLKSTAVVSGMTVLSRILGLVRDIVYARLFGATLLMDAFFVAFKIPNIFRRFFAEGAFSGAFVPTITSTRAKDGHAAAFALDQDLHEANPDGDPAGPRNGQNQFPAFGTHSSHLRSALVPE